ncbi:glycoside hydrolase family 3 C-terminal domain-containing protein [Microbacterium sp. LjRoot45]|uniref:glycoside hydrolase family 3 protein n=1 Tax=Microbacterium sp. LjRoot45 TaxID=3342329 RepID=UPI003ECE1192
MTASLSTSIDGTRYRDLNRNGVMDPYEDPRLPVAARVDDLVARLSLEEKAGLMIQTIVSTTHDGDVDGPPLAPGRPSARDFIEQSHVTHLNIHQIPDPRSMARWVNGLQRVAAASGHGIPVTVSTDPRHSFTENWGASFTAGHLSAWPEPLGLGALADAGFVRDFADIARREYLAVGIRSALHPTLDVATEPRWARQYSTFGQDADVVARLGVAYVDGFEGGDRLTAASVACMAKHFPGGGPEKDGEDPHFPYGTDQVYPGDMFDYHLEPFRRVIARGVPAIMPSYGVPRGLVLDGERVEEVGFGFNHQIITGLLREKLGFDGVVCTDWGLITESRMMGKVLPPRSWGVEHLTEIERVRKALDAGCDQFGGEDDPAHLIELVISGAVPESRLDTSVRRLLTVKFELGLFDDPFVDEDAAADIVGSAEFRAAGDLAQSRSIVVLPGAVPASPGAAPATPGIAPASPTDAEATTPPTSAPPVLPLAAGAAVYAPEVSDAAVVAAGLIPVGSPDAADVAVLRTHAPFEPRDHFMLEASFHAGSLAFPNDVVERIAGIAAVTPVVLAIHLDRPALLAPLLPHVHAVVATFGASERALLDVLTGRVAAEGRLPFEIPRDADAVLASRSDMPGDTVDPVFPAGRPSLTLPSDPRDDA